MSKAGTVISSDGRPVPCTFRRHSFFSRNSSLCKILYFSFRHITSTRTHNVGYMLNQATNTLFDYLTEYNSSNPPQLRVNEYHELTSDVYLGYINYARSRGLRSEVATSIKGALDATSDETGKFARNRLPVRRGRSSAPREPLYDDGYESLTRALITHIDKLYRKLEKRKDIDQATPYTFEEVKKLAFQEINSDEFFYWFINTKFKNNGARYDNVKRRLKLCIEPSLRKLATESCFVEKVAKLAEQHILSPDFQPNDFCEKLPYFHEWFPDKDRITATLIKNGYPFGISLAESSKFAIECRTLSKCDSVVKLLHARVRFVNGKNRNNSFTTINELLREYYPYAIDMAAITIFIALQSNWNKETVMNIDEESHVHHISAAIQSEIIMLTSQKGRSQSNKKTYFDSKPQLCISDSSDPYSTHQLIQLAIKLSKPLKDVPIDALPSYKNADAINRVFLFMHNEADWKRASRHSSASHAPSFRTGLSNFLSEYTIIDNGVRLRRPAQLTTRLRPTWSKYKKGTQSDQVLSFLMGHKDIETFDISYDNSGQAKQRRNKLLRSELEEVLKLLRARNFCGLISPRPIQRSSAEDRKNYRIFHIPGHERNLWGCQNGYSPTWPGARQRIKSDEQCTEILQCFFCSQLVIFEDSLPYIIDRKTHLESVERSGIILDATEEAWLAVANYILESWNDEQAVDEAYRYRRLNSPMLPPDLGLLNLILRTGDL